MKNSKVKLKMTIYVILTIIIILGCALELYNAYTYDGTGYNFGVNLLFKYFISFIIGPFTIGIIWLIYAIKLSIKKKKAKENDWYKPILIFLCIAIIAFILLFIFSSKPV